MKTKFFPFILLLTGISVFIAARASIFPLDAWDEFTYFINGVRGAYPGEWSPLYSAWYSTLYFLIRSPTAVYKIGHALILLSNVLAVYLVFTSAGKDKFKSLFVSSLLLCWIPWSTSVTLINHFDLTLILLLFLLTERPPFREEKLLWMGAGFLFLCYTRPDNIISALLYFILAAFEIIKGKRSLLERRQSWILAVLCIATTLGLFKFNSPFNKDRGWTSFRDHYYFKLSDGNVSQNALMQNIFGDANSIPSAMYANFPAFAEYTSGNFLKFISGGFIPDCFLFEPLLLLPLLAGFLFLARKREEDPQTRHVTDSNFLQGFKILVGITLIHTVVSVSLFEPLFRYYMKFIVLSGVWIGLRFSLPQLFAFRGQTLCAVIALLTFGAGGVNTGLWLSHFDQENLTFSQVVSRLGDFPAARMKSWFPTGAYAVFLEKASVNKRRSPFEVSLPPYQDPTEWVESVAKDNLDVFVFDRRTRKTMEMVLGAEKAESEIRNLTSSCYDKVDTSNFTFPVEIFLRKQSCRK